jgi:hypothetical protein
MLKRIFSLRSLVIFGVCYCALWLLTATVGVRQVRSMVLRGWALEQSCVEVAQEYDGTRPDHCGYYFRAVSYAPFVIALKWDLSDGDFSTGSSGVILWFGKPFPLPPFHSWIT